MAKLKSSKIKKVNKFLAEENLFQLINEFLAKKDLEGFEVQQIKLKEKDPSLAGDFSSCSELKCNDDEVKVQVIMPSGLILCKCIPRPD